MTAPAEPTTLPKERQPALRVVPMPADTNAAGDIFGGWLMAQVDLAGSIIAHQRARGRVATVAVNSFVFHKPVFIGDVVSCYATITRIGTTSITVEVEAYVERNRNPDEVVKVTQATLTYVAINDDRTPRPVPAV